MQELQIRDQVDHESNSSAGALVEPHEDGRHDEKVVLMWLRGKSDTTRDSYLRALRKLYQASADVEDSAGAGNVATLPQMDLRHLHAMMDQMEECGLAASSVRANLAPMKSLMSFAHEIGYLERNWGQLVDLPKAADTLSERILSKRDVQRMIALAGEMDSPCAARDEVMLELLYHCGLRVTECAQLKWRHLQERPIRGRDGGQVTIHGKGQKTRQQLIAPRVWELLQEHRPAEAGPDDAVFASSKGGHLHRSSIWRRVKKAAKRAGVDPKASTHWLRHAHATHALDGGADVEQLRAGLGHASLETTTRYLHARPDDSSSLYLE